MGSLLLWLNIHRVMVIAILAVVFWVTSYMMYLRPIIANWRKRGRPHSWSIDLASKSSGRVDGRRS